MTHAQKKKVTQMILLIFFFITALYAVFYWISLME